MSKFIWSGFADEIDPRIDVQVAQMKRFGISYIEMRGVDGENIADCTPEKIREVAQKCQKAGIQISAMGSPLGKIKIHEDMDIHMAKLYGLIEKAKILNTSNIRIFSFYLPEGEEPEMYRDEVLHRLERMTKAAEEADITLLHENEKGIYGDTPERCLDLLESIGSEHLWSTFDPANFVQCGCEPYPHAYELLKQYVRYVHIKDANADGMVVPAGQGIGHVPEFLKRLWNDGYEGFLSLEPHLGDFVGFAALEEGEAQKKPQSGADTFEVAVNALHEILKGVEQHG